MSMIQDDGAPEIDAARIFDSGQFAFSRWVAKIGKIGYLERTALWVLSHHRHEWLMASTIAKLSLRPRTPIRAALLRLVKRGLVKTFSGDTTGRKHEQYRLSKDVGEWRIGHYRGEE